MPMLPTHPGLRPLQSDIANALVKRILSGLSVTVAWIYTGGGKTLGFLHGAQTSWEQGLISAVMILVPRLNLRGQIEQDWMDWKQFYSNNMGKIVARENVTPLTRRDEFGYVTTYQSVTTDFLDKTRDGEKHLKWARKHQNKFLLVLDEAQFLGFDPTNPGDAPKAAEAVKAIGTYAKHILILTGTPTRSDGSKLLFAKYDAPDDKGRRPLRWHVRSRYQDGIPARGLTPYLREFVGEIDDGVVFLPDDKEKDIASLDSKLRSVMRSPSTWKTLTDKVVARLESVRRISPRYRAIIAAVDQDHAESIHAYLRKEHPSFVSVLAVSRLNEKAATVMKSFKPREKRGRDKGDILVTVGMAYIGWDCPSVCVVGNLSSVRWEGWLTQLVGRGIRIWSELPVEGQMCYYISTNDPANRRFCERMKQETDAAWKKRGEGNGGGGSGGEEDDVVDTVLTGTNVHGVNDKQLLTPEEVLGLREMLKDSTIPLTMAAEAIRLAGHEVPKKGLGDRPKRQNTTCTDREREEATRAWLNKAMGRKASGSKIHFSIGCQNEWCSLLAKVGLSGRIEDSTEVQRNRMLALCQQDGSLTKDEVAKAKRGEKPSVRRRVESV